MIINNARCIFDIKKIKQMGGEMFLTLFVMMTRRKRWSNIWAWFRDITHLGNLISFFIHSPEGRREVTDSEFQGQRDESQRRRISTADEDMSCLAVVISNSTRLYRLHWHSNEKSIFISLKVRVFFLWDSPLKLDDVHHHHHYRASNFLMAAVSS